MRTTIEKNLGLLSVINTAVMLAVLNYAIGTEKRFAQLETKADLIMATMRLQTYQPTPPAYPYYSESPPAQQRQPNPTPKKDRG